MGAFSLYAAHRERVPSTSERSPLPCNLMFIKVTKCASSTTGGVARRIAAKHGLSGVSEARWVRPEPGVWAYHGELHTKWGAMASFEHPTVLWSFIRDPVSRCLSSFYHLRASRAHVTLTDAHKIDFLNDCHDFMYRYLSPHQVQQGTQPLESPQDLVDSVYSFIGLVERYDESLVLLAHLLRMRTTQQPSPWPQP